jgi:peptide/nickel transport system permease protein
MQRYIARRVIYAIISLIVLSLTIFILVRLTGDPAILLAEPDASEEDLQAIRVEFGLDKPYHVQYYYFVKNALKGDMGVSISYRVLASELYWQRLPYSIQLALASMAISLLIGLPVGIISAVKVDRWWDRFGKIIALIGMSMPSFWLGLMLILIFSVYLEWMPTSGTGGIIHLIMPAVALSGYFTAAHMRLTRSSMLEVLGGEYIKLARIKGVPETRVILKHALKNALIPVLTLAGINFVLMINIAVVIESVFAWPGIGQLLYDGITGRDFPVVQTVVLMAGVMVILVNLGVDILYAYIDPRIRFER